MFLLTARPPDTIIVQSYSAEDLFLTSKIVPPRTERWGCRARGWVKDLSKILQSEIGKLEILLKFEVW